MCTRVCVANGSRAARSTKTATPASTAIVASTCVKRAAACPTNAPASTEVCVDGQCTTDWPACDPDADEDNDSSEEALTISPGMRPDLTLCNDEDWYSFFGLLGGRRQHRAGLRPRRRRPHTDPLPRRPLHRPGVGTNDDDESLMRTLDAVGVYYILVSGSGRGVFTSYSLNFVRTRVCNEDDSEDNDTFAEATVVRAGHVRLAHSVWRRRRLVRPGALRRRGRRRLARFPPQ